MSDETKHTTGGNGNVQQVILKELRGLRNEMNRGFREQGERIAKLEQSHQHAERDESERRKDRRWILGLGLTGLGGLLSGLFSIIWQLLTSN